MTPARSIQKTRLSAVLLGLLLLCLVLAFPSPTQAGDSGPIDAGLAMSVGSEADAWAELELGNITLNDELYVSAVIGPGAISQTLQATDYGFSIPENATIDGITVYIGRYAGNNGATGIYDAKVMLIKGGSGELATDKKDVVTAWSGGEQESTYGGEADLWESSWTPAEINDSEFWRGYQRREFGRLEWPNSLRRLHPGEGDLSPSRLPRSRSTDFCQLPGVPARHRRNTQRA